MTAHANHMRLAKFLDGRYTKVTLSARIVNILPTATTCPC